MNNKLHDCAMLLENAGFWLKTTHNKPKDLHFLIKEIETLYQEYINETTNI
jgi:5-methylcytosine-specific restriction endonuclease McrBC regulatory subunit McrC|tara:strand:- start:456 stop:608 length:153 start_codon:yes stop_codon:yes gene_type:complete